AEDGAGRGDRGAEAGAGLVHPAAAVAAGLAQGDAGPDAGRAAARGARRVVGGQRVVSRAAGDEEEVTGRPGLGRGFLAIASVLPRADSGAPKSARFVATCGAATRRAFAFRAGTGSASSTEFETGRHRNLLPSLPRQDLLEAPERERCQTPLRCFPHET